MGEYVNRATTLITSSPYLYYMAYGGAGGYVSDMLLGMTQGRELQFMNRRNIEAALSGGVTNYLLLIFMNMDFTSSMKGAAFGAMGTYAWFHFLRPYARQWGIVW